MALTLSPNGRKFIQLSEGLSLKAYPDASGYSIGYGHFGAKKGDVITQEQADALFDGDVKKFEDAVNQTNPNATQQQFDALVHFAYNVGVGGYETSTVARLLNQGDVQGAADAFRMWTKSNGAVNQELVKRREAERAYFLTGSSNTTQSANLPDFQQVLAHPAQLPLDVLRVLSAPQNRPIAIGSVAAAGALGVAALWYWKKSQRGGSRARAA